MVKKKIYIKQNKRARKMTRRTCANDHQATEAVVEAAAEDAAESPLAGPRVSSLDGLRLCPIDPSSSTAKSRTLPGEFCVQRERKREKKYKSDELYSNIKIKV